MVIFCLFFLLQTTIRPKYIVLFHLLSYVHDNSTKNYGPHWCISFICIRPFNQNIWSSFIYSFLCAQQFDHRLWPTLTDYFYLHMTIWWKTRGLTDLFRLFLHDHSTQIFGPLSFILSFVHDNSTKNYGLHWLISFIYTWPFDQNIGPLSFILSFVDDHSTIS